MTIDCWWQYSKQLSTGISAAERDISTDQPTDYRDRDGNWCKAEGRVRTLRSSYQEKFEPVVEERLQKAAVRFAAMISAALNE